MLETVSKSRFKAKALEYFRKIEQNGQAVIITDHGKPVLQVLRFDDPLEPVGMSGFVAAGIRSEYLFFLCSRRVCANDSISLAEWPAGCCSETLIPRQRMRKPHAADMFSAGAVLAFLTSGLVL